MLDGVASAACSDRKDGEAADEGHSKHAALTTWAANLLQGVPLKDDLPLAKRGKDLQPSAVPHPGEMASWKVETDAAHCTAADAQVSAFSAGAAFFCQQTTFEASWAN